MSVTHDIYIIILLYVTGILTHSKKKHIYIYLRSVYLITRLTKVTYFIILVATMAIMHLNIIYTLHCVECIMIYFGGDK